jgi:hypothetical protein
MTLPGRGSRRRRGPSKVWFQIGGGEGPWMASDLENKVLVAGHQDAVGAAVDRRQSRRHRGSPDVHESRLL